MITIKQNYKSSTRIDGLVDPKQFIDNIVLHGTALITLDTLGKEVNNNSKTSSLLSLWFAFSLFTAFSVSFPVTILANVCVSESDDSIDIEYA